MKEKMGALEKNLEREVAVKNAKAHLGGSSVARLSAEVWVAFHSLTAKLTCFQ